MLMVSINANAGSKLQLDLENLNATLESGFGRVSADLANVVIDPINVEMTDLDYELSMKENYFYHQKRSAKN